jgi:chromosome segregation ATPase
MRKVLLILVLFSFSCQQTPSKKVSTINKPTVSTASVSLLEDKIAILRIQNIQLKTLSDKLQKSYNELYEEHNEITDKYYKIKRYSDSIEIKHNVLKRKHIKLTQKQFNDLQLIEVLKKDLKDTSDKLKLIEKEYNKAKIKLSESNDSIKDLQSNLEILKIKYIVLEVFNEQMKQKKETQ